MIKYLSAIVSILFLPALIVVPVNAHQSDGAPAPQTTARSTDHQRSPELIESDWRFCTNHPIQAQPQFTAMIHACDRAILDPATGNQVAWERQAELLHSKAAWQYSSGETVAALATLDWIDAIAAGKTSLAYDGSTGLANTMLRALLLAEGGRRDEALALLQQARAVRPYALVIQQAIDRVEIRISGDADRIPALIERHITLDPTAAQTLFYLHYRRGNLAAASQVAGLVQFGRPQMMGGWSQGVRHTSIVAQIREQLDFHYLVAYVSAALGDTAGSDQAFAAATERLRVHAGTDPQIAGRASRAEIEAWQGRVRWVESVRETDRPWRAAIALRARLAAGESPDLLEQPENQAVTGLIVIDDMLRLIAHMHPDRRAAIEGRLTQAQAAATAPLLNASRLDLVRLLPENELLVDYPRFGRAGDGIVANRENGYSQAPHRSGEARTFRFGTWFGSPATADELAILAAATYAQREGADSFILTGRNLTERETRMISLYLAPRTYDSGSEGAVLAVLLNSNAIPPQWEAHRSRLIRVADVMASIGARQQAIEAAKAAR